MASHVTCPPGSEPELAATYTPRGTDITYNNLSLYTTGSPTSSVVILCSDIFGPRAGRHRLIADQLADSGFYVLLPDFFRGNPWSESRTDDRLEWIKTISPDIILNDFQTLWKYIESVGNTAKIGAMGFCWGAFAAVLASSTGKLSAGVNIHPSLGTGLRSFNYPEIEQAKKVTCPQLFIPAGNDPENVKPGGEVQQILDKKPFGNQCQYYVLEHVVHGFVPRGDLSKPEVAKGVKFVMETSITFLQKILQN